ncbi:MAG: methylated-DNA--[protein]-cysteine S-methyltransferase, partial [bacterium]
ITFLDAVPVEEPVPNQLTQKAVSQLKKYFEGKLKKFDLPLDMQGTDFQINVWNELLNIPFGETKSYMEIAELVGDKKSIRAVGKANGDNKIAIVIPCHRVIGSDGKLTGYAGGLWRKKWLLDHEKKLSGKEMQMELEL